MDTIGCIVFGSTSSAGQIAAGLVREMHGTSDTTVLGTAWRAPSVDAALVNGLAAHTFDYDDIWGDFGPVSAVLVPAILGAAEAHGATGKQLIAAYGIGLEIVSRVLGHADRTTAAHRDRLPSTVVVLAAAAAVGYLIGAKPPVLANALAIAASNSSGSHWCSGSTVNPLQTGLAARDAILAVELARRGLTVHPGSVDIGDRVFNGCGRDSGRGAKLVEVMASKRRLSILHQGLTVRRFACCAASHAAIDAILELRKLHPKAIDAKNVASIDVRVDRAAAQIFLQRNVTTEEQDRFSIESSVATAAIDGWVGIPQVATERINSPDVAELRSRVQMIVDLDATINVANWPATVVVRLVGGDVLRTSVKHPKGHPGNPLGEVDQTRKFAECCEPIVGRENTARALELLSDLESLTDISDLTACLRRGD